VKIAVVTTSYPSAEGDPAGHFVEREARLLAGAGHHVIVIAPGPEALGAFGWPGALERLRRNPLRLFGAIRFAVRARQELRQKGPFDRIIAHWVVPSAWPIALAGHGSLEVVAHGSDVALIERLPGAIRRRLIAGLLRRGARFRFVSHELYARMLQASSRALEGSSFVEPSPIDVSGAPSRQQARRRLGLAPEARLFVVVARLIREKRVAVALAALELVPGGVVVIGDGPERAELERRFPGVRFTGRLPRDQALTWIAAADLLVSASRREGAPTAVREARALGVPVVAAAAGDLAIWAASDPGISVIRPSPSTGRARVRAQAAR
jgi:teichuronic acid biosynthesis glycosyltransferase TuaC